MKKCGIGCLRQEDGGMAEIYRRKRLCGISRQSTNAQNEGQKKCPAHERQCIEIVRSSKYGPLSQTMGLERRPSERIIRSTMRCERRSDSGLRPEQRASQTCDFRNELVRHS